MTNALVRKIERFGPLSLGERDAIDDICAGALHYRADEEIRRGGTPGVIPIVLGGFAYRSKLLANGRRQIHGLFVPGDLCSHLYGSMVPQSDQIIHTLTPAVVAAIPSTTLLALMDQHPRIARVLWASVVVDEAILCEWVVSLGRRTAYERMAHLFCEIFLRLKAVGLTQGARCELPLTQMDLGDVMGLSTVHVNRVLQQLRRDELIVLKGSQLTVPDIGLLAGAADLDTAYLQLDDAPRGETGRAVPPRVDAA